MSPDEQPRDEPALPEINPAAARTLLESLRTQAGSGWFYTFRTGGSAASPGATRRSRTLLAFASPDAAIGFAQRNQLIGAGTWPRLKRLSLAQLLAALLREPAIVAITLVREDDDPAPVGQLPRGVTIERAVVLEQLRGGTSI